MLTTGSSAGTRLAPVPLLFRPAFLERAAAGKHISMLREILDHVGLDVDEALSRPLVTILDDLYNIMLGNYRCEYVFKNSIANSIFLKMHSPHKSLMLSEFRSGICRADVVILNGTSSVYEIKTELDSLTKLTTQLGEYRKVFDKIYVVTSFAMEDKIVSTVEEDIGILCLGEDTKLRTVRRSTSHKESTSPAHIFDCMRRSEFVAAVKKATGSAPDVPNSRIYSECRDIFCKLTPSVAHGLMVSAIRRRCVDDAKWRLVQSVPPSLKHLCLSLSGSNTLIRSVEAALNSACQSAHTAKGDYHVLSATSRKALRSYGYSRIGSADRSEHSGTANN